jgi:hypothetical protein
MKIWSYVLVAAAVLSVAPVAHAAAGDVRRALRQAGFAEVADQAAAAARPTWRIERTLLRSHPRALGTTRLGGSPDLPTGTPWPQCAGKAQTFLGQIRARDLPAGARSLRKHRGLLLFFSQIEFEDPSDRNGIDAGRCVSVVHAPEGSRLTRTGAPRGSQTAAIRPARTRFVEEVDLPDVSSDYNRLAPPLHDVAFSPDRAYAWFTLRLQLQRRTRDPDHRLLGYVDSPNGEHGQCWWNTRRTKRAPWVHLFSMSYDERLRFAVGDGGVLQIAISPRDLAAGNFDRVCSIFRQ